MPNRKRTAFNSSDFEPDRDQTMNLSEEVTGREGARLEALYSYEVLDSDPEEAFDALTRLASYICQAPISLVSLIDSQRQWFKSKLGLVVPETPREISFCQHAILQNEIFEVEDATRNDLFRHNPLVLGDPNIRFYAGAPLVNAEGYSLGTLCVIDTEPRHLTEKQKDALQTLARQVVTHLELRRARLQLQEEKERLEGVLRLSSTTNHQTGPDTRSSIFVKQESKLVKVTAADILWVEALGDYVNIHTAKERFTIYATLKDMETKLQVHEFVRVHRKYIVRLDKILAIEDDSAIIEKREVGNTGHGMNGLMYVPIGNSYKSTLMSRLTLI